ncbi:MAG TPA: alkaline phosphatase family protein [Thermoplasmata archaeon]|nr:alkaline phosphatase family protein [Thermoplasmata archaeon]
MTPTVSSPRPRVLVLGLDSVSPEILFEKFLPQMPRMRELLGRSAYGSLRSIDPPITVPAWAVMFSGIDPGTLGVYGFRHRRPGSYFDQYVPSSGTILQPRVWDLLSRAGRRVCVIGMPPGYPPPHVNGVYVSDFLTPDGATDYVYPASLRAELEKVTGGYPFDVIFRAGDRERVGRELIDMTRRHFSAARHLWSQEPWDLFAMHEIGPDRIHHAFWKFFDPSHPRYEDNAALRGLAESYYEMLDQEIGRLLDLVPKDVKVLFLSDHGSQAMQGCFCINEWLISKGYLALKGPPPPPGTPLEKASVDWSKTRAWGAGGYYARIFLNIKGREPEGVLEPSEATPFLERLGRELGEVRRPDGKPLGTEMKAPAQIYRQVNGDAPDMMAYFGDVAWRSAGTLGYGSLFLEENDTGPDDAVHSFDGIYVVVDPSQGQRGRGAQRELIDIGPTLMRYFGIPIPSNVQGNPIVPFL